MATATKINNGRVEAEAVAEMAGKVTEEYKAYANAWFEAANKVAEELKVVAETQQKFWQDGFKVWQQYNQSTFDFVVSATQKNFDQSLAQREQVYKLAKTNLEKYQALVDAEQEFALNSAEAWQSRLQGTTDRLSKIFAVSNK